MENKNIDGSIIRYILKEKNIIKKMPIKKSLSESLIKIKKGEINKENKFIKIKNKGSQIFIPKNEFYKMKDIDLSQLKAYKNEKKEIIKQKKIFLEKINNIYNTNIIDIISENKEKEYRKSIVNIQNEIRKKKLIKKEEIKNFYFNILITIKNIKEQINYEKKLRINDINKRINSDINQINILQEKKLDEKLEKINIIMNELKVLIKKMEIIIKDYKIVKDNIDIYIKENINLKKKIKKQNEINKKIIFDIKLKEKNKKIENNNIKKINNNRKNIKTKRKNSDILKKVKGLSYNNSAIYQTNCSTNNIDLLSKRNKNNTFNCDLNNSYINMIATNNYNSTSFISFNNKGKKQENKENINNKEKKIIKNLTNNIENLKNKINMIKKKLNEDIPQNPFYSLLKNFVQNLKNEESDSVIYNIDNKLLTDNMRIFPYQSKVFRQIFMGRFFNNKNLYQVYIKELLKSDAIFNKNIFVASKKEK